jgi:hypothetical protein
MTVSYIIYYFISKAVFTSHIKWSCISLHISSLKNCSVFATKFDVWKCYKQKSHSCTKGNSRTKITDTFYKILYSFFSHLRRNLPYISGNKQFSKYIYFFPKHTELREAQDIYCTYISNLSCDCNSRQRTAHCEAYFSVSCWERDSLRQTRDIEKYLLKRLLILCSLLHNTLVPVVSTCELNVL